MNDPHCPSPKHNSFQTYVLDILFNKAQSAYKKENIAAAKNQRSPVLFSTVLLSVQVLAFVEVEDDAPLPLLLAEIVLEPAPALAVIVPAILPLPPPLTVVEASSTACCITLNSTQSDGCNCFSIRICIINIPSATKRRECDRTCKHRQEQSLDDARKQAFQLGLPILKTRRCDKCS